MKRITVLRYGKGWSQARLAREVGCNPCSISRIENGREPLFPKRGRKIADALGWDGNPEELLGEAEEGNNQDDN